jgi:hypothetical protein
MWEFASQFDFVKTRLVLGAALGDLPQKRADSSAEAIEFAKIGSKTCAFCIGQTALGLMECESFGEDAQEFAMAWIEALPETALFAAVVAEPFFARGRRSAGTRLRMWLCGIECSANHCLLQRSFFPIVFSRVPV